MEALPFLLRPWVLPFIIFTVIATGIALLAFLGDGTPQWVGLVTLGALAALTLILSLSCGGAMNRHLWVTVPFSVIAIAGAIATTAVCLLL